MIDIPSKLYNSRSFHGYTLVNNGLPSSRTNKGPLSIDMEHKIIAKHNVIGFQHCSLNKQIHKNLYVVCRFIIESS